MKITICGSIAFLDKMRALKDELEKSGHEVCIPWANTTDGKGNAISEEEYYKIRKSTDVKDINHWIWVRKSEEMKGYCKKVAEAEAILVANFDKNNIPGYVGANTLMEMGLAHYLGKRIFLLNPIPEISYKEEIFGMRPVTINNNLKLIN